MSYSIAVTVTNGHAEIDQAGTTAGETLADGKYVINGHVPVEGTWQADHIQVTRYSPDSQSIVVQASATAAVKQA